MSTAMSKCGDIQVVGRQSTGKYGCWDVRVRGRMGTGMSKYGSVWVLRHQSTGIYGYSDDSFLL